MKIAAATDTTGTPSNNPHVGCTFYIEWFGYDQGTDVVSTVTFTPQAPTSDVTINGTTPSRVPVGGDAAGGGTDLDGRQAYTLTFAGGAPHPQQGYHVRVTVATPHSLGNDTKTKVYWVQPCGTSGSGEDTTPTPTPTPTPSETPTTGPSSSPSVTPTPSASVSPTQSSTTAPGSGNDTTPSSGVLASTAVSGSGPGGVRAVSAGGPPVPTTIAAGQSPAPVAGSSHSTVGLALAMLGIGIMAGVGGATIWRRRNAT